MRMSHRRLLAPIALLLIGFAPGAMADDAADRASLEAAAQSWVKAFNSRDADALVALATQDVVLLDPAGTSAVSGRQAVRGAWAQATGALQGEVTSATKEAVISGDVAWRIGALARKLSNGSVVGRGQSLEIWKRVKGEWRLHRQMSANILTLPKIVPRPLPAEPILDKPLDTPSN